MFFFIIGLFNINLFLLRVIKLKLFVLDDEEIFLFKNKDSLSLSPTFDSLFKSFIFEMDCNLMIGNFFFSLLNKSKTSSLYISIYVHVNFQQLLFSFNFENSSNKYFKECCNMPLVSIFPITV